MDYQAMWKRLREELLFLTTREVRTTDPHITLAYMTFIQEIEEQKHEQSHKG